MSDPITWPIGTLYCRVTVVSKYDHYGNADPFISERFVPLSDAAAAIKEAMRNPYATAWAGPTMRWKGLPRG
jgi:hypothetical protein